MTVKRLYFLLILAIPSILLASEGNGGNQIMGLVWRIIVFVVFAFILYKLLKDPLINTLDKRTDDIRTALADAVKAKEDAQKELNEYKSKLASMNKELEDMKERAFKAAEAEKVKIISDAETTVARLREFAESLIASDLVRAKAELKNYTFTLAKQAAEDKLRSQLDISKHEKIVSNYIKKIGDLS
jgi:F-type H+-transporting ATPase subunit b